MAAAAPRPGLQRPLRMHVLQQARGCVPGGASRGASGAGWVCAAVLRDHQRASLWLQVQPLWKHAAWRWRIATSAHCHLLCSLQLALCCWLGARIGLVVLILLPTCAPDRSRWCAVCLGGHAYSGWLSPCVLSFLLEFLFLRCQSQAGAPAPVRTWMHARAPPALARGSIVTVALRVGKRQHKRFTTVQEGAIAR